MCPLEEAKITWSSNPNPSTLKWLNSPILFIFDCTPISAVLSAGVYLGCFTLPSASGLQQLEGNVHRDQRNPGTPWLLSALHTVQKEVTCGTNTVTCGHGLSSAFTKQANCISYILSPEAQIIFTPSFKSLNTHLRRGCVWQDNMKPQLYVFLSFLGIAQWVLKLWVENWTTRVKPKRTGLWKH